MRDENELVAQARKELQEELERERIDRIKDRLRQEKWWHRIFPYTIHITKRSKVT